MRIGRLPGRDRNAAFHRLARRAVHSSFVRDVVQSLAGRDMIIGVDRLDYSKGIALRMAAFDRFLASHRDWRGQGDLSPGHAQKPLRHSRYAGHGARDPMKRGRVNGLYGEAPGTPISIRQSPPMSHGTCRSLSRRAALRW